MRRQPGPAGRNQLPWTWRSICDKLWAGADEGVVMRRLVVAFVLAGLMILPSFASVEPAGATVPGENGQLVYVRQVNSQVPGITAGEIYAMNPDGSSVRRLTRDAGQSNGTVGGQGVVVSANSSPRWSPDSPFIAYVHMNESSGYSVRLMDAEGTFIRTVTEAFSPITSLAWSPDGSQLAIVGADLDGGGDGIWIINESGTNPQLLVPEGSAGGAVWSIRDLDWSPDGTWIAFSARSGNNSRQILLANVDAGSLHGPFSGDSWAYRPSWDPSGSRLIFTAYTGTTVGDPDTMGSLDDTDVWVNEYPKTSALPPHRRSGRTAHADDLPRWVPGLLHLGSGPGVVEPGGRPHRQLHRKRSGLAADPEDRPISGARRSADRQVAHHHPARHDQRVLLRESWGLPDDG